LVEEKDFDNDILITGFHGIGMTGYIAISHMLNSLDAERIGYIQTEFLPPFVSVNEDRLLTPFEIYKWDRFVFVRTEFPPHKREENAFAREIAEWTVDQEFEEAFLIGGLDRTFRNGPEEFRIVPTKSYLKRREEAQEPLLETGLYVTGPLAIMLSAFEMLKFPAVAVLPYAVRSRPDPRAASIAVTKICDAYGLGIDVSDLVRDAETIEKKLQEKRIRTEESYNGMYV